MYDRFQCIAPKVSPWDKCEIAKPIFVPDPCGANEGERCNLTNLIKSKSEERYAKYEANSSLNDLSLTTDMDWYLSPAYLLKMGGKATVMNFAPNIVQTIANDFETNRNQEEKNTARNLEVYGENELTIKKIRANIGLRAALYGTGKKNYVSIEPRLALKYNTDYGFSGNAAFTKMSQFIHLLSNSSLGLPTDLWVGSTDMVAPQKSWQLSAGFEKRYLVSLSTLSEN